MYFLTTLGFVALSASYVLATPISHVGRSVSTLSVSDLNGFAPFTQFARAAYCVTSTQWNCGPACDANPDFQPTLFGGDGSAIPHFFVGYWPSKNSVVVAHQGTDPSKLKSLLTDVNVPRIKLDSTLFPGAGSAEVHDGFAKAHSANAKQILAEVKNLISSKGATSVVAVGHSLGGALGELDSLFFTLNLPSNIAVRGVTYGTPRVGNAAFATFFDSKVSNFKRINNQKDLVPIIPGRFLGFQHVQGEVHIQAQDQAVACTGDDDAGDSQCTISTVPNILAGSISNHLGPYQGISVGSSACS